MEKRGKIECYVTKIIQADVVLLLNTTFAAAAGGKDNR
jgi:hypothetical protein